MEAVRELFQQHVQDVLDCFFRGGDSVAFLCSLPSFASSIALLSDEVEFRLMENAFASLRGQTVNGNAATEVHMVVPSLASVRSGRGVGAMHECSWRLPPGLCALVIQRASPQRRHSRRMWFQDSASFLGGGH